MEAHRESGGSETAQRRLRQASKKLFKKVLKKVLTKASRCGIITRSRESETKTDH